MLDIRFIRDNKDIVRMALERRAAMVDLDRLIALDDERIMLQQAARTGTLRSVEQGDLGKPLAANARLEQVMSEWQQLMIAVPNIPDMSVPPADPMVRGHEVRTWGDPRKIHADTSQVSQAYGGRGVQGLYGPHGRIALAVTLLAHDHFVRSGKYEPLLVPTLIEKQVLIGTADLPQGQAQFCQTTGGQYLAPRGAAPILGAFMDRVFDQKELPLRVQATVHCATHSEGEADALTAGKPIEHISVDQVVLAEASHQSSVDSHEAVTMHAEEFLKLLGLPHRVLIAPANGLRQSEVKRYLIEVWLPSEERYVEIGSTSYAHDFIARRLNIRYRDSTGRVRFVHTTESTLLRLPDLLTPLVSHYQDMDGNVAVPDVLLPYLAVRT